MPFIDIQYLKVDSEYEGEKRKGCRSWKAKIMLVGGSTLNLYLLKCNCVSKNKTSVVLTTKLYLFLCLSLPFSFS
jgi:hypothetical protein